MLRPLIDLIIPPKCHVCGEILLPSEKFICRNCIIQLPRTHYHSRENNPVEMRFAGRFPFEKAASHFFYSPNSAMASLIHDFKYRDFPSLAKRLGVLIAEELNAIGWLNEIDIICPVPLHWWKHIRRGYNQSEHLARGIAQEADLTLSLELVARRHHPTQTLLDYDARQRNTMNLFSLHHPERYAGKRVLIVDDVCTTGATLGAAAEAFLKAQPEAKISLLTLAATLSQA